METSTLLKIAENKLFPFFIIFTVSFLTYFQVYTFDFCYDDFYSVLPIQNIEKLSSILRYFSEPVLFLEPETGKMQPLSYYRPIATSTLTIDFFLFGKDNPGWLHVENLLLHTVNACIFFLICRELVGKVILATCAACLYAVFPLATEIVSIYHYRVDHVTSLFIFLTLFATLKNTGRNWAWQVGALFLCAMLCKETAISLLVLIPLFRHFQHSFPKLTELLIALGTPMLIYWSLRYNALGAFLHPKTGYILDEHVIAFSTGDRLLIVMESFWQNCFYLLSPYSIPPKVLLPVDSAHLLAIPGFLILVSLIVAGLFYLKRKNLIYLLAGAILVSWFPVSSILIPIPDFVSPRFFYYPSPWIILLMVIFFSHIRQPLLRVALFSLLFLMWTSAASLQNALHKNNLTKSLGILAFYPYHLDTMLIAGEELYRKNNVQESVRYFNNALVIMKVGTKGFQHIKARATFQRLSEAYIRLNKTDNALFVLKTAISNYPKEGVFYYLSAIIYLQKGDFGKARNVIEKGSESVNDIPKLLEQFEKAIKRETQLNRSR